MEPITAIAIGKLVAYIGETGFEALFKTTVGEATKDGYKWLKSILFKDDQPTEALKKLEDAPDSPTRQQALTDLITIEAQTTPQAAQWLNEMVAAIEKSGNVTVINGKNVVTGNVNAGGNIIVGDNNNIK